MEREHPNRVLVVDDEKAVCLMLDRFLSREGCNSRSTTDPVEALVWVGQEDFDLMISDINMPGMSGLDLLRETRHKRPQINIIIMTAFTDDHAYSEIIEAGASDFIGKPLCLQELAAKIKRIERERGMLKELQETNMALKVILKRIEEDKDQLRTDILCNLKQLVFPYLNKLKGTHLNELQKFYVDSLDSNLSRLASPLTMLASRIHENLSHMEIQIARLIKSELTNKEIAEILGISINTVTTHRYHMRTKLGLKRNKVSLRSYLSAHDF
ncbi:MAG: response regulator [Syntrophobacteraceae bacterium]